MINFSVKILTIHDARLGFGTCKTLSTRSLYWLASYTFYGEYKGYQNNIGKNYQPPLNNVQVTALKVLTLMKGLEGLYTYLPG